MKSFYALELVACILGMMVACASVNCACARTMTPQEQAAAERAAEAAYSAALLKCVADSDTRAAADSCTDAVNETYGRLPDGGRKP